MAPVISEPDLHAIAAEIKQRARSLGFDLVGIAPADPSAYRDYFRQWLDDGRAGQMHYLHRRFDERTDPGRLLGGARTVVCVALNYHVPLDEPVDMTGKGRVARYALGHDYHELIKHRLYDLADWIRDAVPGARTKCGVDSAPVMEKELAARAGIGWIGKHTNVISPHIGSWILLGEVVTTLDLPTDAPAVDRCGTCTRCIDACPTGAITAPYQLDARKCISYLTIEHVDGDVDTTLASQSGHWVYGCDVCQDVCPWNSKAVVSLEPALKPRWPTGTLPLDEVIDWTQQQYYDALRGSAVRRIKLPILQRNARVARQNSPSHPGVSA
jgi:epoxyqueuosine reductase